jgi:hypothetical protein
MKSRGQAMVESLAATLMLTPLLLAVVQLSALQAAEQATVGAARAAALAAHHGLDGAAGPLSSERIRGMFFADPEAGGEVGKGASRQTPSADLAEDIALAMIVPAQVVGAGDLDLARSRAIASRASVEVTQVFEANMPDMPRPRVSAGLPLMLDDWEADSASAVWRRTAALSSTGRIAAWRGPLTTLAAPMRLLEPAVERLCLGRIDPDIVPEDRLSGLVRAPDLRAKPC